MHWKHRRELARIRRERRRQGTNRKTTAQGQHMTILILGLILFISVHMIPSATTLKGRLVGRLGGNGYQGVYSIAALAGLGLIIYGMMQASVVPLWSPPSWGRTVAVGLMPIAFILYVAAFVPSSVKSFTRHPMVWGTVLWALLHLLANGDLASLLLFGGLGAFAVSKVLLIGARQMPELGTRQPMVKDAITITVGFAAFAALLYFHRYVSGIDLL
jgi:uncharacterized membrane protein